MKKIIILALSCLLIWILLPAALSHAQVLESEEQAETEPVIKTPTANAGQDLEQLAGTKIKFSGAQSINPLEGELNYSWDFGDGQLGEGKEITHAYDMAGDYRVALNVRNSEGADRAEIIVRIYEDVITLITDLPPDDDEILSLERYCTRERVYLVLISQPGSDPDYLVEAVLVDGMLEKREEIKKSSAIIAWTDGNIGLNALAKFAQSAGDVSELNMAQKAIIYVTEGSFTQTARLAQSTFDILKPKYLLLAKKTALFAVIDAKYADEILKEVRASGISHNLISFYSGRGIKELGVTNFMSYTVNYLTNKGVSTENIVLMLMLPIIAMIVAFSRQFLGIKTFGIYTPTIITLSFLATGLKYGLTVFLAILIVATVARLILRKFKLSYLPRMAIVLTIVAFVILTMFVVAAITNRVGFISMSILPILVLIILVEKFVSIQIEKGPRTAIMLSLETILVSVACYFIASWSTVTTFVLAYPEVVLLTFVVNILLGKWAGLRISEYIRFRQIRRLKQKNK